MSNTHIDELTSTLEALITAESDRGSLRAGLLRCCLKHAKELESDIEAVGVLIRDCAESSDMILDQGNKSNE